MNTKVDEGKLISGKEALIALANGEDVEWNCKGYSGENWHSVLSSPHTKIGAVEILKREYGNDDVGYYGDVLFRLKPRTITINGIEVNQLTSNCPIYENDSVVMIECDTQEHAIHLVSVLHQVFGGSHE